MKIIIGFVFFLSIFISGQDKFQPVYPPENIGTPHFFNPQTNDLTPIIRFGNEFLIFSFDDLEGGLKRYNYTIEHYNADWTKSILFQSEYLQGYFDVPIIQYLTSFNTYQTYTHYEFQIPNEQVQFKIPGNYVLKVFLSDKNKPLITQRFCVYQDLVSIGLQADRRINEQELARNQWVQAMVDGGRVDLNENPDGAKLFVMKNNHWDDYVYRETPDFFQTNGFTYNRQKTVFRGDDEYNWFDTKNQQVSALTTEKVFREGEMFHTVLYLDQPEYGLVYEGEPDVNGAFYVRTIQIPDPLQAGNQADYTKVYFGVQNFDDEDGKFELYVVGGFNNWQLSEQNKLNKTENDVYEVILKLKQGYYNYQYAKKNIETEEVTFSALKDSYWQTENLYQAIFYYRPWGQNFDIPAGYAEVNTANF